MATQTRSVWCLIIIWNDWTSAKDEENTAVNHDWWTSLLRNIVANSYCRTERADSWHNWMDFDLLNLLRFQLEYSCSFLVVQLWVDWFYQSLLLYTACMCTHTKVEFYKCSAQLIYFKNKHCLGEKWAKSKLESKVIISAVCPPVENSNANHYTVWFSSIKQDLPEPITITVAADRLRFLRKPGRFVGSLLKKANLMACKITNNTYNNKVNTNINVKFTSIFSQMFTYTRLSFISLVCFSADETVKSRVAIFTNILFDCLKK